MDGSLPTRKDSGRGGTARALASRLLALLFGAGVAILLGEVVLRLASPPSLRIRVTDLREFLRFDPRLGWVNRPGSAGRLRFLPDFDHEVRINSRGLRDREVPYERKPGAARILALGDSFTFGQGVNVEQSWPKVLERRLGGGAEVLNAGVSGWGTAQERLWLEAEGFRYRPDLVILGLYVNDFWDNASATYGDIPRPRFVLKDGSPVAANLPLSRPERGRWKDVEAYLGNHSHLFRLLEQAWRWFDTGWLRPVDLTPVGMSGPARRIGKPEGPVTVPAVDVTGALLSETDRLCREHRTRLLVLLVPGHWQVRPSLRGLGSFAAQRDAYEAARKLCAERGLAALDPFPELAAAEARGVLVYNPMDMHLNAAGHRLVAELLARRIESESFLLPVP